MREILFKNITSGDKKQRNFSICEELEQGGFKTSAEKNWSYVITGHNSFSNFLQLKQWIDHQKEKEKDSKREIYVRRICNTDDKKENLSCKICGEFYVVLGFDVFCVKFVHTLAIAHLPC